MPKRTDIKSILIIGAGPIIIGQACEFDYSGAQACKALSEEGYRIILINSNPATIMTDPDMADATYIEPVHWKVVRTIIEKERPDAILPTMGGQTALNCALDLDRNGVLNAFGITMIGANIQTINQAEDRRHFNQAMKNIGLQTARYYIAHTLEEALKALEQIGFPCIIRPSFTMGGTGCGIASNKNKFIEYCKQGLTLSPVHEIVIDESLIGWKEYELELLRDKNDNCIIVCSIENMDPMGIHTGDSITIAPAQTLSDKEYQIMRNVSLSVLREIGVENGGANVQFAINPNNGNLIVVEMNPRISRSSALASKATGFPIARIAARLAVGYTLDELMNEITGGYTPASFEPTIDYVVTKIPRFNFEKFAGSNDRLTTQMKSVGEVMAIGRTFQESLQKALRGLEIGVHGLDQKINNKDFNIKHELIEAGADRILYIADAFRLGMSLREVFNFTGIDYWFLLQIEELVKLEEQVRQQGRTGLSRNFLRILKRKGFSDSRLAVLTKLQESKIREIREQYKIFPVYKRVDTCSAEFPTDTAYLYSTYEDECEAYPANFNQKILILGGGPNRIGQGIEFDYCCVHAALALRQEGFEIIIVNCNPETVSTDYDISNKLYFESVTLEDVLEIVRIEKPTGVIIQYGGQTPLKLATALKSAGVPIIGTSPDSIDRAENRARFQNMLIKLGLKQPANATVSTIENAIQTASHIGYPLVIRPSYVLGGRAMEIIYDESDLKLYFQKALNVSNNAPLLIEHFLEDAVEVDVDAISDGKDVLIGGIMEHIEQAGIHSGDSACSLPAYTLNVDIQNVIRQQVEKLSLELEICGLINIQFAVKNEVVFIIEVNPRAARTVPFVSKATGIPLAQVAALVMVGKKLIEQGVTQEIIPPYFAVKEVVFPFNKFVGVDPILGLEMRSTGEVMGFGRNFSEAFAKAMLGSNNQIKKSGRVLLSVREEDTNRVVKLGRQLQKHGFTLDATPRTARALEQAGIQSSVVNLVSEDKMYLQDKLKNGEYDYIVNTVAGRQAIEDSKIIRSTAIQYNIPYDTTLNSSFAILMTLQIDPTEKVTSLQEMHAQIKNS
ncbi:MAG: carbamoyl-phosphate synthase large subunit [Candidatus Dasytiphilus stammeri]